MVQCWCSWWFRWTTTSVQTGLSWNTRNGWDSLKPIALLSLIVFIESPFHTHSRCPPLHSPSPLRSGLSSTPQVRAAGRTSLSISSQNDLFIITQRSEQTFSFCLNASRYTFRLLETVWVLVDGFRRVFSVGDIPQEAIMVHNYHDHPCGMAQLWEQLWLINQSCWSGAEGEHTVNSASLHYHKGSCSLK